MMLIVYCQVLTWWKDHVSTLSEKASKSLANPEEYKNLFPNFEQSLVEEAERGGLSAKVSSNCGSIREPKLNVSYFQYNQQSNVGWPLGQKEPRFFSFVAPSRGGVMWLLLLVPKIARQRSDFPLFCG